MKHAIILLPKSPRPKKGRIGPDKKQNWYWSCAQLAGLMCQYLNVPIIIPTSFVYEENGVEKKEADFYKNHLLEQFGEISDRLFFCGGNETISQINNGLIMAADHYDRGNLIVHIVWPCKAHFKRWDSIASEIVVPEYITLAHEINTKGRERPKEFIADRILARAFPIIKRLGKMDWYFAKVNAR